jgi:hypothetical protein
MEDELTFDARWQSQPGLDPLELGQAVVEIRRSGGDDDERSNMASSSTTADSHV